MIKIHEIGRAYKEGSHMRIEIHPEYSEGLEGIENLKYLQVLYWMDRVSEADRNLLKVHPQGDKRKNEMGVFALRSPARPNLIGLTRVELLERKGNNLYVAGLDAFSDSPILDIKSG